MKRLPLVTSFLLFLVFCMSLSYWGMQMFKPKVRAVSAPANSGAFEPGVGQWSTMFGRNPSAQAAPSNYQLKGVVMAKPNAESVAILSVDGKSALAIGIGRELSPGVTLKEVHESYVLISESGAASRLDLPPSPSAIAGNQGITVPPNQPMPNMSQGAPVNPAVPSMAPQVNQ